MSNSNNKPQFSKPELTVEDLSLALYNSNLRLMEINRKLQDSERMRSELFSNLSHDLRSPLTSLKSYVEYLLAFDSIDGEELKQILNQMNTKIMSIDGLINDLLLITHLETLPNDTLNLEPVNISYYLDEFFTSCKNDKQYQERILMSELENTAYCEVLLDKRLFHRALDNLFSNALKYSDEGDSISLTSSHNNNAVIISITDTGIGIKADYQKRIFDRTFMVSDARTPQKKGGYGLGLSIVQEIVLKHKGLIWCESAEKKGSTFFISLPLANS